MEPPPHGPLSIGEFNGPKNAGHPSVNSEIREPPGEVDDAPLEVVRPLHRLPHRSLRLPLRLVVRYVLEEAVGVVLLLGGGGGEVGKVQGGG